MWHHTNAPSLLPSTACHGLAIPCIPRCTPFTSELHLHSRRSHGYHQTGSSSLRRGSVTQRSRRWTTLAVSETAEAPTATGQDPVESAVSLIKAAVSDKTVPGSRLLSAILALEKSKQPVDDLSDVLGGNKRKGGKRWQLIFTAGKEAVGKAMKGEKAGGFFFPITAVQRYDASSGEIENGTYFGYPFALTFRGPFEITGRKLGFTFSEIRLRLGPKWLNIPLSPGQLGTKKTVDDKKGPFFLFIYADEDVAVARGRGGGVAMWAATTPTWEVQAGVDL